MILDKDYCPGASVSLSERVFIVKLSAVSSLLFYMQYTNKYPEGDQIIVFNWVYAAQTNTFNVYTLRKDVGLCFVTNQYRCLLNRLGRGYPS